MQETLLKAITQKYPLKKIDVKEFASLKINGMTFKISAYDAQGFGRVSVMEAKGFFGLVKTDAVILSPVYTDLPLYSLDKMSFFGKSAVIVELYDTLEKSFDERALISCKEKYSYLKDRDHKERWYDDIKLKSSFSKTYGKKQQNAVNGLIAEHFNAYVNALSGKTDDVLKKKKKIEDYVNGLLRNGGPSTDVFVKAIGKEKTETLYKKVLFGTEEF